MKAKLQRIRKVNIRGLVPDDLLGSAFGVSNNVDAGVECRERSADRALTVERLDAVGRIDLKGAGYLID